MLAHQGLAKVLRPHPSCSYPSHEFWRNFPSGALTARYTPSLPLNVPTYPKQTRAALRSQGILCDFHGDNA